MNRPIQFLSIHHSFHPKDDNIAPYHTILFHHKYGQIPMYMHEYWEWKLAPWWWKNHYIKRLKKKRNREPLSHK